MRHLKRWSAAAVLACIAAVAVPSAAHADVLVVDKLGSLCAQIAHADTHIVVVSAC